MFRLGFRMDHHKNFCLQSLKDELDNLNDKEADSIENGKKKASKEVYRLKRTSITAEKSHVNIKEEKTQETKIQKEKKTIKFSPTTSKTSHSRSIESQTRILNVRNIKIILNTNY